VAITPGMRWTPALELCETGTGCRLSLGGWAHGEGETLQQAADRLIARLLDISLRFRKSGYQFARTVGGPSLDELSFVWELGEIAAGGGDIRPRVLGLD
jgi:hypothetical protein